jgi:uncharacterized protein (DUF1501 family)
MSIQSPSRRHALGKLLAFGSSAAAPFALNLAAMSTAVAAGANGYKALVCLYMVGGNDHFNTVLPTDSTSWNEYLRQRTTSDAGSIALPGVGASGGVLPIVPKNTQGRTFALHPSMKPMKDLFDAGRAAILANVGTLVRPITLAQYKSGTAAYPSKLFSHNDQQATWQSLQPESANSAGWGGRLGDMMAASNANVSYTCISNGGNALFLTGRTVRQLQVSSTTVSTIKNLDGYLYGLPPGSNPLRQIITASGNNQFETDHAAVVSRAIETGGTMSTAMLPAGSGGVPDPSPYINPLTGVASVNPLAVQLQAVARIIGGRSALGAQRQVFYVSLGSFDSHDNQRLSQADLLGRVAHAIAYFDTIMGNLQGANMREQVTLFTASDFGRTFASNGDGTDHGWGAHHFIVGGAVNGRDIYGTMPVTGVGHDLDVGSGALLPTISVDQYGATLANWFGLSATQIADVFPNIVNFSTRNLGFMNAA